MCRSRCRRGCASPSRMRPMDGMRAVIRYDGPIAAPIEEGQTLGAAVFILPSGEEVERLLVAGASRYRLWGGWRGSERRCATSSSGRRRFYRAHRRGAEGAGSGTGASGGG